MSLVYSPASGQSKLRVARRTGITRTVPAVRPMDQLTTDLGAYRAFNDRVTHIAHHPRFLTELHSLGGVDIALDDAIEDDIGHDDRSLDSALLADGQARPPIQLAAHVAVDVSVQMKTTRKLNVPVDARLGADQRVDVGVFTRFPFEHLHYPLAAPPHLPDRRLPRFPSTSPAPSRQTPGESHGWHLCPSGSRSRCGSARIQVATVQTRRSPESSEKSR